MDPVKSSEITIKLLGKARAHFQKHSHNPEMLKGFPINSEKEDQMAKDIIHRIRVIHFALNEAENDQKKKDTLMESLGKICQMANSNYRDFFATIKKQLKEEPKGGAQNRDVISQALEVLFKEKETV